MRTLNVKRLVVFLVVVIVVAGSAHLLHSYQVQRNSPTFKNQAEAAWNDGPKRVRDALRLMNAYLGLAPHDYEAREELGGWLFDVGQFAATSTTLEELLRSLEKQDPAGLAHDSKGAAKSRRVRHEAGAMRGCRISLEDPQGRNCLTTLTY